jgi:hypothetical protein
MHRLLILLTLCLAISAQYALAAIGCTLSNPAGDLKYLYPEMTTYKEQLESFPKLKDGAAAFQGLRARLGSDLDPIYETYETPYTVYTVFKGAGEIGVVHGVNVPGKGGVIQIFVATDPATAAITNLFFQRLESPAARQLRAKEFRTQFTGLTLADFYKHDYYAAAEPASKLDKLGAVKASGIDASSRPDYDAAMRGLRKNLILLDYFVYGRRFEPYFEKARQALDKSKPSKKSPK